MSGIRAWMASRACFRHPLRTLSKFVFRFFFCRALKTLKTFLSQAAEKEGKKERSRNINEQNTFVFSLHHFLSFVWIESV